MTEHTSVVERAVALSQEAGDDSDDNLASRSLKYASLIGAGMAVASVGNKIQGLLCYAPVSLDLSIITPPGICSVGVSSIKLIFTLHGAPSANITDSAISSGFNGVNPAINLFFSSSFLKAVSKNSVAIRPGQISVWRTRVPAKDIRKS